MDKLNRLLEAAQKVMKGEPARIIGYGGAVVIYLVAKALAIIPDQTPEQALAEAGAALVVVGTFVETIRHYVYSPATVEQIVVKQGGDPATIPAPPADNLPEEPTDVAGDQDTI